MRSYPRCLKGGQPHARATQSTLSSPSWTALAPTPSLPCLACSWGLAAMAPTPNRRRARASSRSSVSASSCATASTPASIASSSATLSASDSEEEDADPRPLQQVAQDKKGFDEGEARGHGRPQQPRDKHGGVGGCPGPGLSTPSHPEHRRGGPAAPTGASSPHLCPSRLGLSRLIARARHWVGNASSARGSHSHLILSQTVVGTQVFSLAATLDLERSVVAMVWRWQGGTARAGAATQCFRGVLWVSAHAIGTHRSHPRHKQNTQHLSPTFRPRLSRAPWP